MVHPHLLPRIRHQAARRPSSPNSVSSSFEVKEAQGARSLGAAIDTRPRPRTVRRHHTLNYYLTLRLAAAAIFVPFWSKTLEQGEEEECARADQAKRLVWVVDGVAKNLTDNIDKTVQVTEVSYWLECSGIFYTLQLLGFLAIAEEMSRPIAGAVVLRGQQKESPSLKSLLGHRAAALDRHHLQDPHEVDCSMLRANLANATSRA